jgi:nucleotide-binding universal stress UspA family protein
MSVRGLADGAIKGKHLPSLGKRPAATCGFITKNEAFMKFKATHQTGGLLAELGPKERNVAGARREQTRTPLPVFRLKSILVPIDFSAESEKALAYAVPFARQFGARLTVLHVVEPVAMPDFAKSFPLTIENDKVMAERKRHLERVVKDLEIKPAVMEKTLVRTGRSFNEIAEAARTLKADLIIIATHGYTGLKHALLGSTTERVVRHAPCPVLVVRSHEHEFVVNNAKPQLKERT